MLWKPFKNRVIAQLSDFITVIFSFFSGYFFWKIIFIEYLNYQYESSNIDYYGYSILFLSALLWVAFFNFFRAYSYQRFTSLSNEYNIVIKSSLMGILFTIMLIFLFRVEQLSRVLIFIIFISSLIFLFLQKTLMFYIAKFIRKKGKDRKNIVIVGTGDRTNNLIKIIHQYFGWGLDIIGIISHNKRDVGQKLNCYLVECDITGLRQFLHTHIVSEVLITIPTKEFKTIKTVIDICEEEGIQIRIISDFFGSLNKRIKINYIYGLPVLSILQKPEDNFALFIKRFMDITISSILLIFLFPLMLLIAILIKITSNGPVFYQWNVIGLDKKTIKSWKFRSMIPDADKLKGSLMEKNEMTGPVFKIKNDPRTTRIGRFIRKYSIDELPQLFSVLKGDLSLVGPRPAGPYELKRYENWHRRKLSIKPGMTCIWQVNGRNKISEFDEWVKMDLYYIDNWSIWLDLKILLKTIPIVLSSKGAS